MLTDSFWEEWLGSTPEAMLDALTRRLMEFSVDARPEAAQQVMRAARRTVSPDEEEELPEIWTVAEFLERTGEPPPPLVEDFLPANQLISLAGLPKEGKTLVALQILQDINLGGPMLERLPVLSPPQNVAYFGMEDGKYGIKRMLVTRGVRELPGYYVCPDSFDMSSEEGWARFHELIAKVPNPGLVVIDTSREAFHMMRDFNDAAEVTPPMRRLRAWAHDHCTVILITHTNKSQTATGVNKVAGSGAWISNSDSYGLLEDQQTLETGNLRWKYTLKGRGVRSVTYRLEMNTQTLAVRCMTDEEAAAAAVEDKGKVRQERRATLMTHARRLGQFTMKEMALLLGVSTEYTRQLVQELVVRRELEPGAMIRREGEKTSAPSYRVPDGT